MMDGGGDTCNATWRWRVILTLSVSSLSRDCYVPLANFLGQIWMCKQVNFDVCDCAFIVLLDDGLAWRIIVVF